MKKRLIASPLVVKEKSPAQFTGPVSNNSLKTAALSSISLFNKAIGFIILLLLSLNTFAQSGQRCFSSPTVPGIVWAKSTWTTNAAAGTVTIRVTFSKTFVDNTYGTNAVGWPSGHTFANLTGSDNLGWSLKNAAGVEKLNFHEDYISASNTFPSGYGTLGFGGDGSSPTVGNASDVVAFKTSLDSNFNNSNYVLTTNSPATDTNYTVNPTYPNWIYDVWYQVTVKLSAFGAAGFGYPDVASIHASPSKTGNNTEIVTNIPCVGSIGDFVWNDLNGDGLQTGGEPGIGGVTVTLHKPDGTTSTTTTSATGAYLFSNLDGGAIYTVSFPTSLPGGFGLTMANAGADNVDSDPNINTGNTSNIVLGPGQNITTVDAGYVTPNGCLSCVLNYPDNSNLPKSAVPFNENDVLRALSPTAANCGIVQDGFIRVWYSDEHALSLGVNRIDIKRPNGTVYSLYDSVSAYTGTAAGQCSTSPLMLGFKENANMALTGNDTTASGNGRPIRPALFLTDLTVNGVSSRKGDWQQGGTPYNPVSVCGSWKTVVRSVDSTKNPPLITILPGTDPVKNNWNLAGAEPPPAGTTDEGYGALIRWDINTLGLIPGHAYRLQVMVHDGDQNKTGGDVGTMCTTIYAPAGSIGDRVWNDVNKNGIQDAGEVGLSGITVSLYDTSNKIIASTVTDAYGNYKFSNLRVSAAGNNYQVRFSLPPEYKFTPQNADAAGVSGPSNSDADVNTGRTGNITLTTAVPDVTYADAGMYYAASARIGDFVWNDLNKNGIQEAGEPGIAGVTVMLYTSADVLYRSTITSNTGQYFFNDVAPGSYYVKINPPIGYKFSPKDAGADDVDSDIDTLTRKTPLITVVAGTINLTIDAGLNVTPPTGPSASLGDRVWEDLDGNNLQDIGEPGVANVTVQLYNSLNVLQATATTDAFGYYIFNGLVPGAYYVKFTLPSGFSFVTANAGADDIDSDVDDTFGANTTNSVTLADDDINTTLDAGVRRSSPGATALGDFVWYDLNKNGIQDGGAEIGVPGITVILYNSANAVVATTATDANGFYLFTGLAANTNYTVGFANLPAGYGFSPQNGAITVANNSDVVPGSGRTGTVTTGAAGTIVTYVDAGLVFTPKIFDSKASIGDYVWNDLNNDGKQDAGEPGIQGVTVTLYAANGTTVVATTTTDAQGYYIFTNLDAGSYVVGFSGLPTGYVFATKNAGANAFDELDSDADGVTGKTDPITLIAGEVNMTVDAGARNPVAASNIGDFVWNDLNKDGIQNAGEPGMEGISVTLLNSAGVAIKNTTTNASGKYLFTDLAAGTYAVMFNNLPVGFSVTTKNAAGSNNTNNSDPGINGLTTDAIVLPANTNDPNWDMGIVTTTRASVGDFVWNDINMNGKQDLGEPGIAGVTVTLYDNNNVAVSRTVTDATGFYLFSNLLPGTYSVGFSTIPAGSGFTVKNAAGTTAANDSDPDQATGKTAQFTLVAGQSNRDMDAGLVMLLAAVGDFVWNDVNRDGLQDPTEPGVAGITATLYSSADNTIGNGDDIAVASAVTNAKGFYLINNIPVAAAGSRFYMRFTDLQGNAFFTTPLAGGPGASNDSKVTTQPATDGYTDFFNLMPGQIYRDVDAGVIRVLSIKGHIWHDANALFDSTVNSSASLLVPPGAKPPAALRMHLVDANNFNTVIRVVLVQRSITDSMDLFYEINDVQPGNYILVLRAVPVAVGTTDPTGQLPDGWKNTGEHLGLDKGWDSYPALAPDGRSGNGKLTVVLSNSDIINANFGIIKGFADGHN